MRPSNLIVKKRIRNIRRKNKIEKIFLWLLKIMPLKMVVRRKKAMGSAIIV